MRSTDRFSDVLDAARGGEEWAITALWRTYQPALLRYLRSSCGGAAEDVASEVWLSIGGKLSKFKGEEPEFRAWLFTLARRRTIDQHRRTARAPLPVAELPEAAIDHSMPRSSGARRWTRRCGCSSGSRRTSARCCCCGWWRGSRSIRWLR